MNGVPRKASTAPRAPVKKPYNPAATQAKRPMPNGAVKAPQKSVAPVQNKAASVAGGENAHPGPYSIMAQRIANRVAEMAESITFVERRVALSPSITADIADVSPDQSLTLMFSRKPRKRRNDRASWRCV